MNKIASYLRSFLETINHLVESLCSFLLATMVVLIVVGVGFRYLLESPISWSEEVAIVILVWFGWLSVATAVYRHSHMAIDAIYDHLPTSGKYWLNIIIQFLITLFAVNIMLNSGLLIAMVDEQTLPASGLLRSCLYFAPLVATALMTINSIGNLLLDRFVDESSDALNNQF